MQYKKNKKRYYYLALWILFLNGLSLKALEIAVKPFGYLGLLYNQGAQKKPSQLCRGFSASWGGFFL